MPASRRDGGAIDTGFLRSLATATADRSGLLTGSGRPLCTLTYAQSVDGCITFDPLSPMAISGHESMRMTHSLRAAHDAVLVGIRTVLADDPRLNVRLADGPSPRPIVVDTRLRTPPTARLLGNGCKPIIATGLDADPAREHRLLDAGALVLRLPLDQDGLVDLHALTQRLAELEVKSLMVEGGGRILTSFLRLRLADQMVITIAPIVIGGVHAFGRFAFEPALLPRLADVRYGRFGEDLVLWGTPSWQTH